MSDHKILLERKHSLSRIAAEPTRLLSDFKDSRSKSSLGLNRHHEENINPNCLVDNASTILVYGHTPSQQHSTSHTDTELRVLAKDVLSYSAGDEHVVVVNAKGQLLGLGRNSMGQFGKGNSIKGSDSFSIISHHTARIAFSTAYTTFFLTQDDELYGCGLNNCGQLGLSSSTDPSKFRQIGLPLYSSSLCTKSPKNYRLKSDLSMERAQEQVTLIAGGPFHTLCLTSQGRLFHSGLSYKASGQHEASFKFTEMKLKKPIKCLKVGLACYGYIFCGETRLQVTGMFSKDTVLEVHMALEPDGVVDFCMSDNFVTVLTSNGRVSCFQAKNGKLAKKQIHVPLRIESLYGGSSFCLLLTAFGDCYGFGQLPNYFQRQKILHSDVVKLVGMRSSKGFLCSSSFCLAVAGKDFSSLRCRLQKQVFAERSSNVQERIRTLQDENRTLKDLVRQKIKPNPSRFSVSPDIVGVRTFEQSLEIPFEEITLGKQISEGGYGVIYKAYWRKTLVAVKMFKIQPVNKTAIKDFVSQCYAMEALRHPNIVMFLGACTKGPNYAIVLEYCEGGTLWSLLQRGGELSWQQKRNLALETARAMNYLHSRKTPILHRDLKSLNVLIDSSQHVKLADFGWTKGLQDYMTNKIGTYQWMAPEVASSNQYTEKADVYSFGIIMWEIAAREAPYRNIPGMQVAHDVVSKGLRPKIPKKTPEGWVDLMQKCWHQEPSKRPGFEEIISLIETTELQN